MKISEKSLPHRNTALRSDANMRENTTAQTQNKNIFHWNSSKFTTDPRRSPPSLSHLIGNQNHQTVAAGFEAKTRKPSTTLVLRLNQETVQVVLGLNHSQTVDLGVEAQPRNPRSSSTCARCRPHTAPPDLLIARPPSTRPMRPSLVLCTRSPIPIMILVAARHATPATCTPRDKQTRFSERKKDKR
jgi:hypothetical protein